MTEHKMIFLILKLIATDKKKKNTPFQLYRKITSDTTLSNDDTLTFFLNTLNKCYTNNLIELHHTLEGIMEVRLHNAKN